MLVLAAVLLALLAIRPAFQSANRQRRLILHGLRAAVVLLVVLALLRPTVVHTKTEPIAATVAFLLDTSRSMRVSDVSGATRFAALLDTLRQSRDQVRRLHRSYEVVAYDFAATAKPLTWDGVRWNLPEDPQGDETDLGAALDQVLRDQGGKRLLGVVLCSDGAQRTMSPQADMRQSAWQLARRDCPLFTVAYGVSRDQAQARDIAVQNLQDHYRVFANTDLVIRSNVQAQGFANSTIPVELRVEDEAGETELVGPVTVTPRDDTQQMDVEFTYQPKQPGQYKLTLTVPEQPGEQVKENNELTAFLDVLEGGLRVLYLCGNLGWQEHKFIRRVIDQSVDMQLDFQWIDDRLRQQWPIDMAALLEQGPYDVYVLADVEAQALGAAGCMMLAHEVDAGKGLIMTGGRYALGPGGYGETALAEVLPVSIGRFQKQPRDGALRSDLHIPGPLKFLPTTKHFITTLARGPENRQVWQELPPLGGANQLDPLKPITRTLAAAPDKTPLLVASEYGQGRVLGLAVDSTYRWYRYGFQEAHKRFWRQVILWLARKEDDQAADLWIKLEQRRYMAGAKASFTAGVRDGDGAELEQAQLVAELLAPGGQSAPIDVARQDEGFAGSTAKLTEPGDYVLIISAYPPDADRNDPAARLATREVRFTVLDRDLELSDPAADPQQLANLALITKDAGGRVVAAEELPALLDELLREPEESRVEFQSKWQLTDTPVDAWLFFLTVVALLSIDWYLRKKWLMV